MSSTDAVLPWLDAAETRLNNVLRRKSSNESDTVAIKERISELQVGENSVEALQFEQTYGLLDPVWSFDSKLLFLIVL